MSGLLNCCQHRIVFSISIIFYYLVSVFNLAVAFVISSVVISASCIQFLFMTCILSSRFFGSDHLGVSLIRVDVHHVVFRFRQWFLADWTTTFAVIRLLFLYHVFNHFRFLGFYSICTGRPLIPDFVAEVFYPV